MLTRSMVEKRIPSSLDLQFVTYRLPVLLLRTLAMVISRLESARFGLKTASNCSSDPREWLIR